MATTNGDDAAPAVAPTDIAVSVPDTTAPAPAPAPAAPAPAAPATTAPAPAPATAGSGGGAGGGAGVSHDDTTAAAATTATSLTTDAVPMDAVEGREDLRIAMIGNVDSGKSTLVGCLTKGGLDDGRGSARTAVFRHRHERENGRTSSVAVELMGFRSSGKQVLLEGKPSRPAQWKEISARADRSITLIDLCGHEKYLKTTVFGLTGMSPDYCLVVVGANMGVSRMTKEHIGIASALHLPMIVVVTKTDLAPKKVFRSTMNALTRALKAARKMPFLVRTGADVPTAVEAISAERIAPVMCVSNVTGEGLDNVRSVLRSVPSRAAREAVKNEEKRAKREAKEAKKAAKAAAKAAKKAAEAAAAKAAAGDTSASSSAPDAATVDGADAATTTTAAAAVAGGGGGAGGAAGATAVSDKAASSAPAPAPATSAAAAKAEGDGGEMTIDSVFQVPGVGCVVAGMVLRGTIKIGSTMMLGPSSTGEFQPVTVRSIHVHYTNVEEAVKGRSAAVAIRLKNKKTGKANDHKKRAWVRKGMSLVAPELVPQSYWTFEAEILVLHHQTTLSVGYSPTIHCGVISQTARIMDIRGKDGTAKENLRTGDRAIVRCQFMYRPEYIATGAMLLFREGRAKGVGKIRRVIADAAAA